MEGENNVKYTVQTKITHLLIKWIWKFTKLGCIKWKQVPFYLSTCKISAHLWNINKNN